MMTTVTKKSEHREVPGVYRLSNAEPRSFDSVVNHPGRQYTRRVGYFLKEG
jgi:hypothetical protein